MTDESGGRGDGDSTPGQSTESKPATDTAGTLYVCATPIGNLEDASPRLLRLLDECHLVAAEDTRVTRKLLAHFELHTPLIACHQHTPPARIAGLVRRLQSGERVALVCTAGTPGVSDPGPALVRAALEAGVPVRCAPGPAAVTAALSVSGMGGAEFHFAGFLPRRSGLRRQRLQRLAELECPLVFHLSPHGAPAMVKDMHAVLGDREVVVCRELTKLHEEVSLTTLGELRKRDLWRGECVLVVEGAPVGRECGSEPDEAVVLSAVQRALAEGKSQRDAVRETAAEFGVSRQQVYRWLAAAGESSSDR